MPVRVIDIPNLNPTRINAAPMNPNAAGAPAQALGELAQGIASIGEPFREIAGQIQDAHNSKLENEAHSNWRRSVADLQQKLATEPDAGVRRKKTDDLLHKLQTSYDEPGLPPIVRDRLRGKFTEFADTVYISAAADAARLEGKQSDDAFTAGWTEAVRIGDRAAAASLIETRRQYRLITPGEEKQLWQQFDREESVNRLTQTIQDDPLGAIDLLKKDSFLRDTPGVSESDRLKFLRAAEAEVSTLQKQSIGNIAERIERQEITTEAELEDAWKDNPFVEDGYKDELRWSLTQRTPVDQETRFGLVDSLNDLADSYKKGEMSLDEYRQSHDELGRAIYSLGARDGAGALRQRLHATDPSLWTDGRELKETDRKKSLIRSVESISKLYADQDAFGDIDEDAEPAARAQQAVEAQQRRGRIEQEMGRWIEQHPEATEDELPAHYRKTYMAELSGQIVSPGSTAPDRRRQLLDDLRGKETSGGPKGAHDGAPDSPVGGDLKSMVKQFEAGGAKGGFHASAYWDEKQWSIGYGTKSRQGEVIDQAEAERRLDSELSMHRKRVVEEAKRIGMTLSPHELDALTSFDYNTGRISDLLAGGTRSKAEIASKMLLYRNAGGKRLRGLESRRIAEAKLFRRGWGERSTPNLSLGPDGWSAEDPTHAAPLPE